MLGEELKAKAALYGAIFLTFLGYGGRFAGLEPFNNQFFAYAAWAYILFADNLTYRLSGSSPLISRTGEFAALAAWSVAFSGVFELLNLRLDGWHYIFQPATLSVRWTGRALAWGAFLPSLFATADLLRCLGLFRNLKCPPLKVSAVLLNGVLAAGLLLAALALAWPARFWPLIWLAPFFLADPLNYKLGLPSLLREWQGGVPGKTLRLTTAGIVCGLLWSAWNGAAGARWAYAPFKKAGPEVFGLPLPAYLAFGLFALGAYSAYALASWLREGRTWEEGGWAPQGRRPPWWAPYALWPLLIITSYIVFRLTDAHLVKLYLGWI
ncbi:MAG: hypothetical protein A2179_06710 [Elusimicrobia bacterium GWC2_63_65]|nr:MAG: hypothetical protein A2179_06710 [Elusimicrobia bacterium GWC2_63_65]